MNLNEFIRKVCDKSFLVATFAISVVIFLIALDVIFRVIRMPIDWSYEVIMLTGAIAIGASLPKTTFNKAHVIMEFGIGDRSKSLKIIFALINRCCGIITFAIFSWMSFLYGNSLWKSHQVTPMLHVPEATGPYFLGFFCFIVCIVLFGDLFRTLKKES